MCHIELNKKRIKCVETYAFYSQQNNYKCSTNGGKMMFGKIKEKKYWLRVLLSFVIVGIVLRGGMTAYAVNPSINVDWWKKNLWGTSEQHFKITVTIPSGYGYANDISKAYNGNGHLVQSGVGTGSTPFANAPSATSVELFAGVGIISYVSSEYWASSNKDGSSISLGKYTITHQAPIN